MGRVLIVVISLAVLLWMSWRANHRYRDKVRLPMQWSFGGGVNWTAPRRIALSFTPVLAAVSMILILILSFVATPEQGQDQAVAPVFLFLGLVFIGLHALHLKLIDRSIRKNNG